MSMGYLIKIDGSPFWQARLRAKSGVEVQRSTSWRCRRRAMIISAPTNPGHCAVAEGPFRVGLGLG